MRNQMFTLSLLATFLTRAAAQCPSWSSGYEAPGINGSVTASAVFDDGSGPALYAAGQFLAGPSNPAGNILRWNGTSWSSVGASFGTYSRMNALAVFDDGAGSKLYVGGNFYDPIHGTLGGVQVWNGQQWTQLGASFPLDANFDTSVVLALAVYDDGTGPHLYAAGEFGTNIAKWNGASWVTVGGSLFNGPFDDENFVDTLAVFDDGAGGGPALYAGGRFRFTGNYTAIGANIARTYGSTWASAGALGFADQDGVYNLAAFDSGTGPKLVAAGALQSFAYSSFHLAQWNGTGWTPFAADVDGTVTCLRAFGATSGVAPGLWVSGGFAHAGNVATPRLARWDGAQWHTQGDNAALAAAYGLEAFDDGSGAGVRVFALGSYVDAVLTNNHWSLLMGGGTGGAGANSSVTNMLSFDDPALGRELFAAGDFSALGQAFVNRFARWDGVHWTPTLALDVVSVYALAGLDDGSGTKVFASGIFGDIGNATAMILRRVGMAWTQLPALPNSSVAYALEMFDDGSGPHLFAGVSGSTVPASSGLFRLDGSSWTQVFATDSGVTALKVFDDGSGAALFLAGPFTTIGGVSHPGIARWNGQTIDDLGGGAIGFGGVRTLCVFDDGHGPRLHAGGHFTAIGGTPCSSLARWDGSSWSSVGGGVQGYYPSVYALAVHDDGTGNGAKLVVGGWFDSVGGQSASDLATWDGAVWNTLGGGLAGANANPTHASALASFDDGSGHGPDLFVGGAFLTAGGHDSANIARLTSCGGSATTFCYGDGSATACPCGNASAIGANAGCLNSLGSGGTLRVSGRASIAHDTLELLGGGMTNSFALYYQGANIAFGGQGFVFGDGVKCLAGPFVRLRTKFNVNGASSYPNAGDASVSVKGFVATPGTRHYQIHYRNSASFCMPETFNNSNAISVAWEL